MASFWAGEEANSRFGKSTLARRLVSVVSKGLTGLSSPLESTLTKKWGGGYPSSHGFPRLGRHAQELPTLETTRLGLNTEN